MYAQGKPPIFFINCPVRTTPMLEGTIQQMALPNAYNINPATDTFFLPNLFASGQTAKMPMPMGIPPITEMSICVTPSL